MAVEKFSDIPVRANGEDIDASWFNTIRTLLVQIFGDMSGEASQSIGNADTNQNITDVSDISAQEFSRVDVEYSVRRTSSTANLFQCGEIKLIYKSTGWEIHGEDQDILGDDALISWSIFEQTVGGYKEVTLRYSTTDAGGTGHVGTVTTRVKKWAI